MNTHAGKAQENKNQSMANAISQKRSGGKATFQFVDNRPEFTPQRKLQDMANNRPQVRRLVALQEMANISPHVKQTAQLQAMTEHAAIQKQTTNNIPLREHYSSPLQLRQIDAGAYSDYDEDKTRDSTKAMFEAAALEDEVDSTVVQAQDLLRTLDGLREDEMVRDQAGAKFLEVEEAVTQLDGKKKIIAQFVDRIIAEYQKALKPEIYGQKFNHLKSTRERMGAKADAIRQQEGLISAAIGKLVGAVRAFQSQAHALYYKVHQTVRRLQNDSAAKHQARKSYEFSSQDYQAQKASFTRQAGDLMIAVGPDIEKAFQKAQAFASGNDWIEAGKASDSGSRMLEDLKAQIAQAKKDKQKYEAIEPEFAQCTIVSNEFGRLHIQDTGGGVVQLQQLRQGARLAAQHGEWAQAFQLARQYKTALKPLEALVKEFQDYADGAHPKLLAGTLVTIFKKLTDKGAYTNQEALALMLATYKNQCAVTRLNWLLHLKIASGNMIGPANNHYTTFNDSVPNNPTFSVYGQSRDNLLDALLNQVSWDRQIHATYVVGVTRYHKYWDETYSPNVSAGDLENTDVAAYKALNSQYDKMIEDMQNGVTQTINSHGRVADNKFGRQNQVPDP